MITENIDCLNGSGKRIIAIIQARMSSQRLPKKVLTDICGKPMLWHIVNRAKGSVLTDEVIIATSDEEDDKPIYDFANKYGIPCFRGSKLNVLDRFWKCANLYNPDIVLRLTGDNPLIDPYIIDEAIIEFLKKANLDYLYYREGLPLGTAVEIMTFSALTTAYEEAKDSECLEHVTPYIYRNNNIFSCLKAGNTGKDYSHLRWTMDTDKDQILITKIYNTLYEENKIFHYEDVIREYNHHDEWLHLNDDIIQKRINYIGEMNNPI